MHSISVKVNDADFSELEKIAKGSHRSRSDVIGEAIRNKLDIERFEHAQVMKAIEQADAGEVISHGEMLDYMEGLNK